jgi:hypothetical protein
VAAYEAAGRGPCLDGDANTDCLAPAGVYAPHRVEYEIAIGMRSGHGEAVVAGLGRTEREFSERDRGVLDVVRPASRARCEPRRRAGASYVRWPPTPAGHCRRAARPLRRDRAFEP